MLPVHDPLVILVFWGLLVILEFELLLWLFFYFGDEVSQSICLGWL
jgi:hypothetical protein